MRSTILLVVLLAAATSSGCSATGAGAWPGHTSKPPAAPRVLGPARAIHTAGGKLGAAKIAAVAAQPGTQERYVVLMEWVQQGKEGIEGRYRLIRLDLTTGGAQDLGAVDEGEAEPRHIACARNSRIAVTDEDERTSVREPNGSWRAVTDRMPDTLQEPIAWSRDSQSLLCHHFRSDPFSYVFTAATSASPSEPFRERSIAHAMLQDAIWSPDGAAFYGIAFAQTGMAVYLISIEWPSGKETTLLRGQLGDLSVAEDSGTLAFTADAGGDKRAVWRMQPGSKPEPTAVVLPSEPTEFEVSPDGKYVAAVLGKWTKGKKSFAVAEGGLAIYRLNDAAEYRVPDTTGQNVMMLQWVLGGRAVVYTVVPQGFLDWESKAMGKQVWLAEVGETSGTGKSEQSQSVETSPSFIHSRTVPAEFARAYRFLEFVRCPKEPAGGFEAENAPHWNVSEFLSYLSPKGVIFTDVNEGGLEGHRSLERIREELIRRSGAVFERFAHLSHIYSIPYAQYSELTFRKVEGRFVVNVGGWYDLTFVPINGKLYLSACDYLMQEGD